MDISMVRFVVEVDVVTFLMLLAAIKTFIRL